MPKLHNAQARIPTCHPERKHLAKGLCKSCYDAQRVAANREHHNARKRDWAARNPDRRLATRRKYLYGIDQDTIVARFKAQDGLCKICLEGPAEHLDHDHVTGQARGLLCGNCNRALGLFREDRARLARAIAYLDIWDVQVRPNTGEPVGQSTRGLT